MKDLINLLKSSVVFSETYGTDCRNLIRLVLVDDVEFCASPVFSLQIIPAGILIAPNRICGASYAIPVGESQHAYDTYVQLRGQGTCC